MTQTELAKIFGVSQVTICRWENGESETDFATLLKISKYFGVAVDYLINDPD